MSDYLKEKEERAKAEMKMMMARSKIELFFFIVILLIFILMAPKEIKENITEKTELANQHSQQIFKNLAESEYEALTCYSSVEVSGPKETGFFKRITADDSRLSYNVYLNTNEEYTKDCFKQYVSYHWELSHFDKFGDRIKFIVYVRDKNGRTFTYENYKEVELHSEDDYLTHRSFEE